MAAPGEARRRDVHSALVHVAEPTNRFGRDIALRSLLVAAWLAAMTFANFRVPAYKGFVDEDRWLFVWFYLLAAVAALLAVRSTAPSRRSALASSAAPLVLLAAAGGAARALNRGSAEFRGEPLFLYVGVALLVSWGALVVSSAVLSRARWTRPGGLAVTLFVAGLGLLLATIRID
jgi:hypothetical protein